MTAKTIGTGFRIGSRRPVALALMVMVLAVLTAGEAAAQWFGNNNKKVISELERRMARIEKQNRILTGEVERLTHHIREMQKQMRQMQDDYESRIQALESGRDRTGKPSRSSLAAPDGARRAEKSTSYRAAAAETTAGKAVDHGAGDGGEDDSDGDGVGFSTEETARLGEAIGRPLDLSAVASGTDSGDAGDETAGGTGTVAVARAPVTPREAYDEAYNAFLVGKYRLAEQRFRDFLKEHPDHKLTSNALFWVGESLLARGKLNDAGDEFLRYYETYPKSRRAPDSLLKLGQILVKLEKPEIACKVLGELAANYPDSPSTILHRAEAARKAAKCA